MEERQIEIPDLDLEDGSDSESIKSPKMEMVEVIKLHMTSDMPTGKDRLKDFTNVKTANINRPSSSQNGYDNSGKNKTFKGSITNHQKRWKKRGLI